MFGLVDHWSKRTIPRSLIPQMLPVLISPSIEPLDVHRPGFVNIISTDSSLVVAPVIPHSDRSGPILVKPDKDHSRLQLPSDLWLLCTAVWPCPMQTRSHRRYSNQVGHRRRHLLCCGPIKYAVSLQYRAQRQELASAET
jgi:hypothetical protein